MEFRDFENNPKELIGKRVLISGKYSKSIGTISRLTKTSFAVKIGNTEIDSLFDLANGIIRSSDKRNSTKAILLSLEKEEVIKKEWKENLERKNLTEKFNQKINSLTIEQITKINEIIGDL